MRVGVIALSAGPALTNGADITIDPTTADAITQALAVMTHTSRASVKTDTYIRDLLEGRMLQRVDVEKN
jgi:hypothetical protein